jgi:signal transduction histidine kinase
VERRDRQPWRLGPRGEIWFDLGLTAFLLLPVPVYLFVDAAAGVLMLAQIAPLALRRRHPVAVFAVIAAASGVQALALDEPLWSQVAFPIAVYSVARYAAPAWGFAAVTVGLAGAVVASVDWLRGFGPEALTPSAVTAYVASIATMVVAAWALGALGRTRQAYVDALVERGERLEREAAQQAELAAVEERNRIAREMHDVVAHGLTTIVVQADGARHAGAHDPATATTALGTIAGTGREALAELRRMLGLLRSEDATRHPQPRLPDLTSLIEDARAAGTEVRADLPEPLPAVSDGVALTAYRIVQEALSNVRKHAGPGAVAEVRMGADPDLTVEVVDDGRGAAASYDGRGLGLTGMAERVAAHGGELEVGARQGGGFRVCARIPR